MIGRVGIVAVVNGLLLGPIGASAALGGSIQNIIDGGGSTTQGGLTFTFAKMGSVTGTYQNGALDPSKVLVTFVPGGITFATDPFMDLKTQAQASYSVTIDFTVTAAGGGQIGSAGLSFSPGLVETGGRSEVMKTFPDRNEALDVFRANALGTITEKLSDSTTFADLPNNVKVKDIATAALTIAQGNQRTIQLMEFTNTFAVVPEPSTFISGVMASVVGLGYGWKRRGKGSSLNLDGV